MRSIFPTLLLLCVVIPTIAISQYSGSCKQQASEAFTINAWHQHFNAFEEIAAIPPVCTSTNRSIQTISYQDQYFQLGCTFSGFQEYFSPSRWRESYEKGDGGVDVTGAPNSVLVEGANIASVVMPPGSSASYEIVVPASGYVQFDWRYIGGSNFLNQRFEFLLNGRQLEQLSNHQRTGAFFSGFLEAGDIISLNGRAVEQGFEIRISNFEYLSNAIGVYEREWTAVSNRGEVATFRQLISIKKPEFSLIMFPPDYDGYHEPTLSYQPDISPEWTGYPVFDLDGSDYTTMDQYAIDSAKGSMDVSWKDECIYDAGYCIIYRNWLVNDFCGRNTIKHTQIIKVEGACPEIAPNTPDMLYERSPALPGNYDYTNEKSVSQASFIDEYNEDYISPADTRTW
jgi:hypothetical protein